MDNDKYVYELEQALSKLLEFFEPCGGDCRYIMYNSDGDPQIIDNEELEDAVEFANGVLYGEDYEGD